MRFVYLDESGIGDPVKEPITVVAGVIVHPDTQLDQIKKHLHAMTVKYIPPDFRKKGFKFHASHLFHGGLPFTKEQRELRWQILEELCSIPKLFKLPVVAAACERESLPNEFEEKMDAQKKPVYAQASAALVCTLQIERFARYDLDCKEVVSLLFEDNQQSRHLIRTVHNNIASPDEQVRPLMAMFPQILPIEKIMEEVFFQEKSDSSLLQLADACAFSIRRKLSSLPDADRFFAPIYEQLIESSQYTLNLSKQ